MANKFKSEAADPSNTQQLHDCIELAADVYTRTRNMYYGPLDGVADDMRTAAVSACKHSAIDLCADDRVVLTDLLQATVLFVDEMASNIRWNWERIK
jgi:hypothetical protein